MLKRIGVFLATSPSGWSTSKAAGLYPLHHGNTRYVSVRWTERDIIYTYAQISHVSLKSGESWPLCCTLE